MKLRPFFSFFGSKYRLAKHYPAPVYDKIIEPFAGSAGYSLYHSDKDIVLYDLDYQVSGLWKWLIEVDEDEILKLPDVPRGMEVTNLDICDEAKWLIGFWITESQTYPSRYHLSPSRDGSWGVRKRRLIASQLQYIRHWKVYQGNYKNIPNEEASWYVDPPYVLAGKRYRTPKLNFGELGEWCTSREGQVIVCEQQGANWLPFEELLECSNASNKKYKEVVFVR